MQSIGHAMTHYFYRTIIKKSSACYYNNTADHRYRM